MIERIKQLIKEYDHALLLLYFPVYMIVFYLIESYMPNKIHIISCKLDQFIPFCEWFVIPYLLWFVYIIVTGAYFFFREKESFRKFMYYGMIGMTIFLVVSILYPNGLEIRPMEFTRDNIFVELTKYIYRIDPPRNVLPSIHVFNSIAAYHCIMQSPSLKGKKFVKKGALLLTILIISSTMLLKQHSVFDVMSALVLAVFANDLIFNHRLSILKKQYEYLRMRKKIRLKYKEYFR